MVHMGNVSMMYKSSGTQAAKNLSLDIDEGEFVFLVGPSGSGKTTIIKLLTGEVAADEGEIVVNGFDLRTIKRRHLPKLRRTLGRERRLPQERSGGEQQRVAVARALVNSPRMIIADEPTGNLDPARSLELMLLMQKINELGTTLLVVTHEKELVNAFSKRVISIEAGSVVSDGMDGYYRYEG